MNVVAPSSDQRRAQRKRDNFTAAVVDTIRDRPMDHLGNLSATGMLLICREAPRREAVYQLRFPLHAVGPQIAYIEVGVQEQWHAHAASPGQIWAGFRIIAISPEDAQSLESWLALPI